MESRKSDKRINRRTFLQGVTAGAAATGAGVSLAQFLYPAVVEAKETTTLEVLDPRGELTSPKAVGLSTPRVTDLNGKRIALLNENSDLFFDAMEKLLKEAFPTATILRFPSPASPMVPDITAEVAKSCDVWLEGVKTATSGDIDYDVKLEKMGKPGAAISVESLVPQRRSKARINGMPTIRIVSLPGIAYFSAKADREKMYSVASEAFDDIVKALTEPLTKAERNPEPFHHDYSPKKFTGSSYAEANEKFQHYCHENFISDGLPIVPPTREAVDAMLKGTSRLPSDEIGIMDPHRGIATVEKIAINSVMAGAKPEYLPVIITAIECITDKSFCQYHIVTGPLPVIWISGPIVEEIGMNNEIAYLSPGYRANSTIGRAVAMCMINIGWRVMNIYAMPGGPGTPVAYTNYLVPENQKQNPWKSFSVERGYKPEESTVSVNEVIGTPKGPGETLSMHSFEQALDMIADIVKPVSFFGSTMAEGNRYTIVLHPTFASQLASAGFTKQSFVQWLYDKTAIIWDKMNKEERERFKSDVTQGKWGGIRLEDCKSGLALEPFTDPKNVAVLVSGDAAGQTLVFPTPFGSTVRRADSPPEFKNMPFMTKVIHGATLTKSGR